MTATSGNFTRVFTGLFTDTGSLRLVDNTLGVAHTAVSWGLEGENCLLYTSDAADE